MKMLTRTLTALSFASAFAAITTVAQFSMTFDENGNGSFAFPSNRITVSGALALDPVSGITTLCYDLTATEQLLQFTFTSGDVVLFEQGGTNYSDLVRFEQNNAAHPGAFVYFFSDHEFGEANPDLADVGVPPIFGAYSFAMETGVEGNNQCLYQPTFSTQPGFLSQGVTYTIISAVPEPSPLAFFGLSAGGLLTLLVRRRPARI